MSRSRVVLPQPDGPSTVVNEPCGTWRVTSSTARVAEAPAPKDFVTPVIVSELMPGPSPCGWPGLSERISSTVAGIETSTSSSA